MENYSLLIYISCIIFLIIIGKVFIMPLKKIMKLVINSAIGAGLIYIINLVGANFNFHIGLNWFTIICTGILGIPGVILVIMLRFISL